MIVFTPCVYGYGFGIHKNEEGINQRIMHCNCNSSKIIASSCSLDCDGFAKTTKAKM